MKTHNKFGIFFENFANKSTGLTGTSGAFILALLTVIIWALLGPVFKYSESWQLVINTGTTIITFLMVFLIQKSQNKDSLAIQLKLNELIAANKQASNRMVNIENLTESDLNELAKHYLEMSVKAHLQKNMQESHSIEEEIIQKDINI